MFQNTYEFCLVVFLLQGFLLPWLVVLSGFMWWKQARRLEALRLQLAKPKASIEKILEALPKLAPLACGNCGSSVLLRMEGAVCPACRTPKALPEDYLAAGKVKRHLALLTAIATRRWRIARVLVSSPVTWFFRVMIFVEPLVLFPVALIGSNLYPDTWIDRAFISAGEGASFVLVVAAFLGFIIWMVLFILLANLSKELRRNFPALPHYRNEMPEAEVASCHGCGGLIEYGSHDVGCICSYCNGVNLRVQFLRAERHKNEGRRAETKSVLFAAMRVMDEFVGTFFVTLLILVGAGIILCVVQAVQRM